LRRPRRNCRPFAHSACEDEEAAREMLRPLGVGSCVSGGRAALDPIMPWTVGGCAVVAILLLVASRLGWVDDLWAGITLVVSVALLVLVLVQMHRARESDAVAATRAQSSEQRLAAIEKRLSLQPDVYVLFGNLQEDIEIAPHWDSEGRDPNLSGSPDLGPMPNGYAGLTFQVGNCGETAAENVKVFIVVPDPCKIVLPPPGPRRAAWVASRGRGNTTSVREGDQQIRINVSQVAHGLRWESDPVYVVFPPAAGDHRLTFAAYAANMDREKMGELKVRVAGPGN